MPANFAGMAFDIGLQFDEQALLSGLERVAQAADRANDAWERLNNTSRQSSRASNTNGAANALGRQAQAANNATNSLTRFGIAAGVSFGAVNLLVNGIERVASATVDFVTGNVKLAASLEQVQTNFTTYLKSATAAKDLIGELTKFAAETPFTQNDIFGNAEKLLGFGFAADEVTDTLRRLGDISGGSSEKLDGLVLALGQVRAKQRVQGEELLQFAERGVPIYEALAKAIGKSVPETQALVSEGKVGFGDLQKAIKGLTDEGGQFAGILKNQSQSFNGLVSTLTSDFERLRAQFGTLLLPLLKDLAKATDNLIKGIDVEASAAAFQRFGAIVSPAFEIIKESIDSSVIPALKVFRDEIGQVIDRVARFVDETDTIETAGRVVAGIIDAVSIAFSVLSQAVSSAVDGVLDFATPIINALQPAVNAVLKTLDGFVIALDDINKAVPEAGSGFATFGNIVAGVASVLGKGIEVAADLVAALFGLGEQARSADPIVRGLGNAFAFILTPIKAVVVGTIDLITAISTALGLVETAEEKSARLAKEQEEINKRQADLRRAQDLEGREEENNARRLIQLAETKKKKTVELTGTAKDAAKAAKDAAKAEEERARLRIALIEDETERTLAEEKKRYDDQVKEIKRLFSQKGKITQEGQKLLLAAEKQYNANVAEIEGEAFTKEQTVLADRLENQQKFTEEYIKIKQEQAAQAKAIDDIDIQIAEAQVEAYLARLRKGGADEQEIEALQEQFDLELKRRRLNAQIKYNQELIATLGEGDADRRAQLEKEIQLLQSQLSNVQFELDNPEPVKIDRLKEALKRIKKDIADALGLDDPDQLDAIAESAIGAFTDLFSAFSDLNQAEIDKNQRAIDKIKEKVSAQQELVDAEKALFEQGKANNLKSEQERLDGILKEQEKYEERAAQLREKAAKRQLAQEIASQVANTVSAVAKIYNANAGVPIIGMILAGVQIAALFAGISAARQKAKAATADRFYKGGMLPIGKTDKGGRTGHMIEGTNIMVGGGEMVVREDISQENADFLQKLNAGAYRGVDFTDLMNRRDKYLANQEARLEGYRQAADMVMTLPRSGADTALIIQTMERHHAETMRKGWKNMLEMGYRVVDKEGKMVHFSGDLSGNSFKSIEK